MSVRHFIDNAPAVTLSAGINGTATSFVVSAVAGLPSLPFLATIDRGTASAEQILVTAIVGTTLTVTRNDNGLGAFSHAAGAALEHTANARDFSEANTHVNASSGVHGLSGAVVGTTDTQTLSNKTLSSPAWAGTSTGVHTFGSTPVLPAKGSGLAPVGTVIMFAGSSWAPSDWLECNGSAVSRATYSGLFSAIGTTFGVGDGSTTFNLPDLGSRFPYGATRGSTGGAASHTHPLSDAGQAEVMIVGATGNVVIREVTSASWTDTNVANGTNGAAGSARTSGAALKGATDSTATLPPYLGLIFLIKA